MPTSDTGSRLKLIDAAEALMQESGYAAVTTRRVAAQAGLKPQLVHYHFGTMDDLFLAVFQRMAEDILDRQRKAADSDRPLHAMWDILSQGRFRLLIHEFVALGNHRKSIQGSFIRFGGELRQMQIALMERVLAAHGIEGFPWTPAFAAILLHSLARFLSIENALGVSEGHSAALAVVHHYLDRFEGAEAPIGERLAALEAENAALRARLGEA